MKKSEFWKKSVCDVQKEKKGAKVGKDSVVKNATTGSMVDVSRMVTAIRATLIFILLYYSIYNFNQAAVGEEGNFSPLEFN